MRSEKVRSLHRLTVCALFAALICVLSPISIPLGAVPMSLGLLGILITAVSLPPSMSVASVLVYLLLGVCGLPLFSGGGAGLGVLIGPTGGYLWSYLLVAPLVSLLFRFRVRRAPDGVSGWRVAVACLCGVLICYACGTVQYSLVTHTALSVALSVCVLPFVLLDLFKIAIVSLLAPRMSAFSEGRL